MQSEERASMNSLPTSEIQCGDFPFLPGSFHFPGALSLSLSLSSLSFLFLYLSHSFSPFSNVAGYRRGEFEPECILTTFCIINDWGFKVNQTILLEFRLM